MMSVEGILTFAQILWLVCFLFTTVTSQPQESDSCSESIFSSTCILPDPQPNLEPGHLNPLWLEMRCLLGCIEKYEDDDMEVIDNTTEWPTVNFKMYNEDCTLNQKIRECKHGCLSRHMHQSRTINRCRDICYSNCLNVMECRTCQDSQCPRACRKTYCRFGCEVYDETNVFSGNNNSVVHPPSPSVAPTIVPVSATTVWKSWLYTIDTEPALLAVSENPSGVSKAYSKIAYLIRISTSDNVYYIWQKEIDKPLNLSPFACSTISVSFAVLSKYSAQQIQFSPAVSFCVSGVGGYPSQLDKRLLDVTYTEDLRESFLGYSIANVSWSPPNNSHYLTSYTIRVYPDLQRCGGTRNVFVFTNINKEFTSFILQASKGTNGLWRFGCSYLIEVVSVPTVRVIGETIGAYVSSTSELSNPFPSLKLHCTRVWDEQGHFSISVKWSFNNLTQMSHITRYIVTPILQVGNRRDNIVRFYNSTFIQPQIGDYSMVTQTFVPRINHTNVNYVVDSSNNYKKLHSITPEPIIDVTMFITKVRLEKNESYYWRDIPHTESCSVPATPLPPSNITNISVSILEFNRTTQMLHLVVNLTPPDNFRGVFREYELMLLTSHETCIDCEITQGQRFVSKNLMIEINTAIKINSSSHCLYLRARTSNHYNLSGSWYEIIIPIDEECNSTPPEPKLDMSLISVIYEREDGSKTKVLEFGCAILIQEPSIALGTEMSKIQAIHLNIQDISLRIQEFSPESSVMNISSSEEQLTNIEKKLNSIITMLKQKQQQGT